MSDRFAPSRYAKRYRDRKKNGRAYFGVECDDYAIRMVADALRLSHEKVAALLIEAAAMKMIANPDPYTPVYRVQPDGSCWQKWPDGILFHWSTEEWAKWCKAINKIGATGSAGSAGWCWEILDITEMTVSPRDV
jgi:hypothetical protein